MTNTWPWVCSLSLATSGTLKSPIEGLLWLWSELSELWARLSVRQMFGENAAPSNVAANVTARIAFIISPSSLLVVHQPEQARPLLFGRQSSRTFERLSTTD